MKTEQQVLDILKREAKPLRPGDIATLGNIEKDAVAEAIQKLKKEEKICSPKRCYYSVS